jgi:hypothetical protein
LDSGQQQAEVETDQIDVSDREHHLTLEYYSFVENVAEELRQLQALIAKNVACTHRERSPTK